MSLFSKVLEHSKTPFILIFLHCLIFTTIHFFIYQSNTYSYKPNEVIVKQNKLEAISDLAATFTDVADVHQKMYYLNLFLVTSDFVNGKGFKYQRNTQGSSHKSTYQVLENGLKFVYLGTSQQTMIASTATGVGKIQNISNSSLSVYKINESTGGADLIERIELNTGAVMNIMELKAQLESKVELLRSSFLELKGKIEGSEKKLTFFQFFYFVVVTSTTVGFGDITPVTLPAQLITILNAITGLILFAFIASFLFDKLVKKSGYGG